MQQQQQGQHELVKQQNLQMYDQGAVPATMMMTSSGVMPAFPMSGSSNPMVQNGGMVGLGGAGGFGGFAS